MLSFVLYTRKPTPKSSQNSHPKPSTLSPEPVVLNLQLRQMSLTCLLLLVLRREYRNILYPFASGPHYCLDPHSPTCLTWNILYPKPQSVYRGYIGPLHYLYLILRTSEFWPSGELAVATASASTAVSLQC